MGKSMDQVMDCLDFADDSPVLRSMYMLIDSALMPVVLKHYSDACPRSYTDPSGLGQHQELPPQSFFSDDGQ